MVARLSSTYDTPRGVAHVVLQDEVAPVGVPNHVDTRDEAARTAAGMDASGPPMVAPKSVPAMFFLLR